VTALHPGRMAAAARGDLAERMTYVAEGLARMVRDADAEAISEFLDTLTPAETRALLIVQAAMNPADTDREQALAWITWDEFGYPIPGTRPSPATPAPAAGDDQRVYDDCGAMKAYWRHKHAGHSPAQLEACGCAQAYRDYLNARYQNRRGGNVKPVARKTLTEQRRAEYARLTREQGETREAAAGRLGISLRTAERYEATLKAAVRAAA
jgi:hypothetical protein